MRNYILILAIALFASCEKNYLEDDYFSVVLALETSVEEDAILAYDGWQGTYGRVMTFEALDVEGYSFVGWKKAPAAYCQATPLIDSDNPRILYVDNPIDFIGNCNTGGLEKVVIYPAYVRN